jgi:hypothetical protein
MAIGHLALVLGICTRLAHATATFEALSTADTNGNIYVGFQASSLLVFGLSWQAHIQTRRCTPNQTFAVHHALHGQPWSLRGSISIDTTLPPPPVLGEEDVEELPPSQRAKAPPPIKRTNYTEAPGSRDIGHLILPERKHDFYHVALVPMGVNAGLVTVGWNFTVPLCLVQSSRFRDQFILHLHEGVPFHAEYLTQVGVCDKKPKVGCRWQCHCRYAISHTR